MANRGTEEGTRRTIRGKRKAIKAQNEGIERTTLVDELANAFTRLAKEAASGAEEGGIKSVVDWAKALNSAGPGVHPGRALSTALVLASPTGSGRPFELLREKLAGEVFPCSAPVEKLSTSASAALSAAADDLTRFDEDSDGEVATVECAKEGMSGSERLLHAARECAEKLRNAPVVVMVDCAERADATALGALAKSLAEARNRKVGTKTPPIGLVLGLETAPSVAKERISEGAAGMLEPRAFRLVPASERLEAVTMECLANPDQPIPIGFGLVKALLRSYWTSDFCPEGLGRVVRLALAEHAAEYPHSEAAIKAIEGLLDPSKASLASSKRILARAKQALGMHSEDETRQELGKAIFARRRWASCLRALQVARQKDDKGRSSLHSLLERIAQLGGREVANMIACDVDHWTDSRCVDAAKAVAEELRPGHKHLADRALAIATGKGDDSPKPDPGKAPEAANMPSAGATRADKKRLSQVYSAVRRNRSSGEGNQRMGNQLAAIIREMGEEVDADSLHGRHALVVGAGSTDLEARVVKFLRPDLRGKVVDTLESEECSSLPQAQVWRCLKRKSPTPAPVREVGATVAGPSAEEEEKAGNFEWAVAKVAQASADLRHMGLAKMAQKSRRSDGGDALTLA